VYATCKSVTSCSFCSNFYPTRKNSSNHQGQPCQKTIFRLNRTSAALRLMDRLDQRFHHSSAARLRPQLHPGTIIPSSEPKDDWLRAVRSAQRDSRQLSSEVLRVQWEGKLRAAAQRHAAVARAERRAEDLRISADALGVARAARREAAEQVTREELAAHRRAALPRARQREIDRTLAAVRADPLGPNLRQLPPGGSSRTREAAEVTGQAPGSLAQSEFTARDKQSAALCTPEDDSDAARCAARLQRARGFLADANNIFGEARLARESFPGRTPRFPSHSLERATGELPRTPTRFVWTGRAGKGIAPRATPDQRLATRHAEAEPQRAALRGSTPQATALPS
jgi:hypothetical protein